MTNEARQEDRGRSRVREEMVGAGTKEPRCVKCGYCLAGHSGAVVRCPECGWENPRVALAVSEASIERELRRMETLPTLSAAAACIFAFSAFAVLKKPDAIRLAALVVGALLWSGSMLIFARTFGFKAGWFSVIAWYQSAALALVLAVTGICFVFYAAYDYLSARWRFGLYTALIVAVLLGRVIASRVAPAGVRGFYTRARERFCLFAREKAIKRIICRGGSH